MQGSDTATLPQSVGRLAGNHRRREPGHGAKQDKTRAWERRQADGRKSNGTAGAATTAGRRRRWAIGTRTQAGDHAGPVAVGAGWEGRQRDWGRRDRDRVPSRDHGGGCCPRRTKGREREMRWGGGRDKTRAAHVSRRLVTWQIENGISG